MSNTNSDWPFGIYPPYISLDSSTCRLVSLFVIGRLGCKKDFAVCAFDTNMSHFIVNIPVVYDFAHILLTDYIVKWLLVSWRVDKGVPSIASA